MSNLTHYSSDGWKIVWTLPDGVTVDFAEGLSKGSFVAEARATPTYTHKPLLNGDGVRSYSADTSGTVTFLVDQSSKLHQRLLEIYYTDRESRNQAGTITCTLLGPSGNVRQKFYRAAYIMSSPDESDGDVSADVSWVFGVTAIEKTYPQNNNAIVGV